MDPKGNNESGEGSSSSIAQHVGQRPMEEESIVNLIADGSKDIAVNIFGEQLVVGVDGRRRFQKIFVLQGAKNGKLSSKSYVPKDDAPKKGSPISIKPTLAEIESRANTVEFQTVGLVLAEDPRKYSTSGTKQARSKKRNEDRVARGVLPAESNVLRAMVPITDSIGTGSIKYYVACNQTLDVCEMRVITADCVFFFAEIWENVPAGLDSNGRRREISEACKTAAARSKVKVQREMVQVAASETLTTSNILAVTPKENSAAGLLLHHAFYKLSRSSGALAALNKNLQRILPEIVKKPQDDGILAFFDFGTGMKIEEAESLISALQNTYTLTITFDPVLIRELHACLRRLELGGDLPYKRLLLFLQFGHDRAQAGWASERLDDVVQNIINDVKIVSQVEDLTTSRTDASIVNKEADIVPLLNGVVLTLSQIINYFNDQTQALRDQHGGLQRHESIESIMTKIGNCVDKSNLKVLMEQIFNLHAEQLASANGNGVKYIEECKNLLEEVMASISMSSAK